MMLADGDWGTPFLGYGQASALTTRAVKKRPPASPAKGERRPKPERRMPFGFRTSRNALGKDVPHG
jgi:hypothetical protein